MRSSGQGADAGHGGTIDEIVHGRQRDRGALLQRGLQAGPAQRFCKGEGHIRGHVGKVSRDPSRQSAPAHGQHHQVGRAAQLFQDFQAHGRLPLDHVGRIEGGQELRILLCGKGLGCGQRLVEVIPGQHDLDRVAAKDLGLVDLLPGRRHRHEDRAPGPEMTAGKGHAMRVIARAGANEMRIRRLTRHDPLAHCIERAPQLVAAHGGQVLSLEPDLCPELG